MIAKQYQKILQNELHYQVKLELLAETLPLPILFESRRKKLRRFLRLESLSIEMLWFPCIKSLLETMFEPNERIYIALDRTSWGYINILMVSVIYDYRAWPVYWTFLDKKGSSNLEEQKEVLSKGFAVLSGYVLVVLGDREFCSPKLGKWLGEEDMYFCLRQKCNTNIQQEDGSYRKLKDYGLRPGKKCFLKDKEVTKGKGFGKFNIAGKGKRT